jgi:hypothetical protein
MHRTIMIVSAASLAVSSVALAHGEGVDVLLRVDDGQIVTGSWSHDTDTVVEARERVFAFEWGEGGEGPNIADEPGFFAETGTLAGLEWGVNFVDAVRVWNGSDFDTVSPHTVTFEFLSVEQDTPTTAGGFTQGFGIPVGSGGFDDHYEIVLNAPTDGSASGVFLISMSAFAQSSTLGASVPAASDNFWFVGNFGADEMDHEAAIEYVEEFIVPAPGAAALFAMGGLALARRRR